MRFALRQFRKAPAFTLVAILTLALGIGANTAVFTLLDQVVLRSLPVQHPEQLVRLRFTGASPGHVDSYGGDDTDFFSHPMYGDLRDQNRVFDGLIANDEVSVGVQWNNQSEVAAGELVSGNYFQVLGVQPALGRLMVPSDDQLNAPPVAVVSFHYWNDKLGADPHILGRTLLINAQPFAIIGVTAPGFRSVVAGQTPNVFVPMSSKNIITPRWPDYQDRKSYWLTMVGRLKPGESLAQAQAGLQPLWHALRAEEFKQLKNQSSRVRRLFLEQSQIQLLDSARGFSPLRDQIGKPLIIVMSMVGLLVLMACVNVASLLLVRAAGRTREMAVRFAMGAGRWRVVRQLLIEGLMLGLAGGALGLLLAPLLTRTLVRLLFTDPSSEIPFSTHPDLRIFAFNFAVAFVVSVLFSLAPAWRFLRPDLVTSLKQQTGTATGSSIRVQQLSVAVQIGLSLVLLIGAGLFVRTLENLRTVNVGFVTDHLLSFSMNARLAGYQNEQLQGVNQRVLDALAALPGVRSVAATDDPDLENNDENGNVSVAGYNAGEDEDMQTELPLISSGYFTAMQIPLVAGRDFTPQDGPGKANVAIVNDAFARHYFGSAQNAIGHMVATGGGKDVKYNIEIVGVVGDTKHSGVRDPVRRTMYRSLLQSSQLDQLAYLVRTWQPPELAESQVRGAVAQLDSKLAIANLRTVNDKISDNLSNERLMALLSVSFAVLAMLLAAIGLYGVLAYATAQRTREIGIRMAMGAQRSSVVRMVLRDVLWLAGITIAVTLPLSWLLTRTLSSQLYGVSAGDPLTFVAGMALVAMTVMLAAAIPAARAARAEPMQALRDSG